MPTRPYLIDLRQISKTYPTPAGQFTALKEINMTVTPGEFVAVVGRSGSGKSTLLNLLTGIDRPSQGEIYVSGSEIHNKTEDDLAVWRGQNVGVVFQFFQLLPTLTILENVMLPMDFANTYPARERRRKALDLLCLTGVADQAAKLPASLSGGQQQRAAIARALANDPPILVADEPTGNLDSRTTEDIFQLFSSLSGNGKTILVVTHERDIVKRVGRVITLADGEIIQDTFINNNKAPEVVHASL